MHRPACAVTRSFGGARVAPPCGKPACASCGHAGAPTPHTKAGRGTCLRVPRHPFFWRSYAVRDTVHACACRDTSCNQCPGRSCPARLQPPAPVPPVRITRFNSCPPASPPATRTTSPSPAHQHHTPKPRPPVIHAKPRSPHRPHARIAPARPSAPRPHRLHSSPSPQFSASTPPLCHPSTARRLLPFAVPAQVLFEKAKSGLLFFL